MSEVTPHDPKQHPTRTATLYRLRDIGSGPDQLEAAFDAELLAEYALTVEHCGIDGMPAAVAYGMFSPEGGEVPGWRADAERLTGLSLPSLKQIRSGLALAVAVDGDVYAMGFGFDGYRLIRSDLKDRSFGLRFAIRAADADEVRYVGRKSIDVRGRQDHTRAAAGLSIYAYGIRQFADIVRRLGVRAFNCDLTFQRNRQRAAVTECGDGIRLPVGAQPADLVHDVREIARVVSADPHPDLAFIEQFREVDDPEVLECLEMELDDALVGKADHDIALIPPMKAAQKYAEAGGTAFKIGGMLGEVRQDPEFEDVQGQLGLIPDGVGEHLRTASVHLFEDGAGREKLCQYKNLREWLEVTVRQGWSYYVLSEDQWFEIGESYAQTLYESTAKLIRPRPSLPLPPWPDEVDETYYNKKILGAESRFLSLHPSGVRTDRYRGKSGPGLEICDVLGPYNELIHVKRSNSGGVLTYLFSQGTLAAEALCQEAEAAERFAEKVADKSPGRRLPEGFRPEKIIYAIQLGKGKELSADTLTPFTQTALRQAVSSLKQQNIQVELIGIPYI